MHVAMLSPVAWRTPPRSYGPWEYRSLMDNVFAEFEVFGVDDLRICPVEGEQHE